MSHADAPSEPKQRIAPVDEPTDEQKELLAKTMSREGRPLRVFATLAHHPRLLKRFNALGGLFMTGELEARERELIVLRVAARVGSDYEYAQHVLIGREAGLTDDEIAATAQDGLVDWWSDDDRLLLRMADELLDNDLISDETYRLLEQRYTPQQLLELLLLPGFYRMLAGALRTLRVSPENDLPTSPSLAEAR